jgi:hypothetical protein
LSRYGREFGLAYASGQLVHFALVVWVIRISHLPLIKGVMPFFAIGVVWTCVLALSSFDRVRDIFGANLWRILRSAGVEYIALVFFEDFVLHPIRSGVAHSVRYLPFSILTGVGPFLRIAAIVRRLGRQQGSA